MRPEDAMRVSTYSLRRFFPTVADRLRIPVYRRHDLGDWCDTPLDGAVPVRHAPMAVRYSDARLESSADSRRVCHLALYKARLANLNGVALVPLSGPSAYLIASSQLWIFSASASGMEATRLPTTDLGRRYVRSSHKFECATGPGHARGFMMNNQWRSAHHPLRSLARVARAPHPASPPSSSSPARAS